MATQVLPPVTDRSPAALAGLSVLVVEDTLPIRRVLVSTLERAGAEVTGAAEAETAVETCRSRAAGGRPFDAVVLDHLMPRKDGAWAASTLRADGFGGALIGKVGSVFTSTASQHGGQETTITSFHTTLLHHGMVIVGLPYSFAGQTTLDEITGGSPYGATTIAGGKGERQPSENELAGARFQGRHVAEIAAKLAGTAGEKAPVPQQMQAKPSTTGGTPEAGRGA